MPEQQRRLAAIMFTDIVGYTTLMGRNEAEAFKMLERNRAIHKKYLDQFNGHLIKEMGDGTLASFDSISNAIQCASSIQKDCKEQNIFLKTGSARSKKRSSQDLLR